MEFTVGSTNQKLKTNRICLFDADFVKYIITSRKLKNLNQGIEKSIEELCEEWHFENVTSKFDDYVMFCFSGKSSNTFRYFCAINKEYKGNRKNTEEHYPGEFNDQYKVVEWFNAKTITVIFPDLEADDIVSSLQDEHFTYILSNDKDINQISGWHYSFSTNNIFKISIEDAVYNLAYQLVRGDAVDNIGGIKGYGDVKTQKYLEKPKQTPKRLLDAALYLYKLEFGQIKGYDAFVESWNLVKLRTDRGDYFRSKYIKMFDLKEYLVNRIKTEMK